MDIEGKIPDPDPPRPAFNRERFWATAVFSVFALQTLHGSVPLLSENETTFGQRILIDVLSLYGVLFFIVSFGFLIGFKPVVVAGFFITAFWPVLVEMWILLDSESLRNLAIVLKRMWICVPTGYSYIIIFNFKSYGKRRLIGIAVAFVVLTLILKVGVLLVLPQTWSPAVNGIFCSVMGISLYFNIPNTVHIENITLPKLLASFMALAGYLVVLFAWLHFRIVFDYWVALVLLLVVCIIAGALNLRVLVLSWQTEWKQFRAEWNLNQETVKEEHGLK